MCMGRKKEREGKPVRCTFPNKKSEPLTISIVSVAFSLPLMMAPDCIHHFRFTKTAILIRDEDVCLCTAPNRLPGWARTTSLPLSIDIRTTWGCRTHIILNVGFWWLMAVVFNELPLRSFITFHTCVSDSNYTYYTDLNDEGATEVVSSGQINKQKRIEREEYLSTDLLKSTSRSFLSSLPLMQWHPPHISRSWPKLSGRPRWTRQ